VFLWFVFFYDFEFVAAEVNFEEAWVAYVHAVDVFVAVD
jgi:hypothetical protein